MNELKLTFKDSVQIVAEATGHTQVEVNQILEQYIDVVKNALKSGRGVAIKGLGNATPRTVKAKEARIGRNPSTGEDIAIPAKEAHSKVHFKVSKSFQDEIAELTMGCPFEDR